MLSPLVNSSLNNIYSECTVLSLKRVSNLLKIYITTQHNKQQEVHSITFVCLSLDFVASSTTLGKKGSVKQPRFCQKDPSNATSLIPSLVWHSECRSFIQYANLSLSYMLAYWLSSGTIKFTWQSAKSLITEVQWFNTWRWHTLILLTSEIFFPFSYNTCHNMQGS